MTSLKKKRESHALDSNDEELPPLRPWYNVRQDLTHKPFTVGNQLKATIFYSWINLLLFAVPAGLALYYVDANPVAIFFVNFAAVVPMASLLGLAMDELRLRTGDVLGALVYISFGYVE